MVAGELEGTGTLGMRLRGGASGTATRSLWGQGKDRSQRLEKSRMTLSAPSFSLVNSTS